MFDPNQHPIECEKYLSRGLASTVRFLGARPLTQSSRTAPWRLNVEVNGQEQAFVLQLDARGLEYEYQILKALEPLAIPTPRVYGLDLAGEALGLPCFFSDFIDGETLLNPLMAGEPWAEEVYLQAVCNLQSINPDELGEILPHLERVSAEDILEESWSYFKDHPHPLAEAVYQKLQATKPAFPKLRFSNGDLWLENFIVQDERLAGVIDFRHAGFSDPVFEFLLSFFVEPKIQGRNIEARYCQRIGIDPVILGWYHGLELFETWRWVLSSGKNFVHHSADSLEVDLGNWLQVEKRDVK